MTCERGPAAEAEAGGSSEAMEEAVVSATAFGVAISIVTWPRPVTVPVMVRFDCGLSTLTVSPGGTAISTTVGSGGSETVLSGGTASNTVMMPNAIISSGAICFATSMGAFGTAFTLATQINVLPLTIYNEFTNYANFAMAASLSIVLGLITWAALALARSLAGSGVAAAG